MKDHGICPSCGQNYIWPGLWGCKDCVRKNKLTKKKHDPDGMKNYTANKARREMRMANGLCIDCGKPSNGASRCERCAERHRISHQVWDIKQKLKKSGRKYV